MRWALFIVLGIPGVFVFLFSLPTLLAGEHPVRSVLGCIAASLMILTGVGKLRQPFYLLTFAAFVLGFFLVGWTLESVDRMNGKDVALAAVLGAGIIALGVNALVRAYYTGHEAESGNQE